MNRKLLIGIGAVLGLALVVAIAASIASEVPTNIEEAYGTVTVDGNPLPVLVDPSSDVAMGLTAPTIIGTDPDGNPVTIGPDGRSKVVLVVAHWCPFCQAEVPDLVSWLEQGGGDPDVDLYALATSTDPSRVNFPPQEWLRDENWPAPIILDDEAKSAGLAYGVASFPFWLILDGDNRVVMRFTGRLPNELLPTVWQVAKTGVASGLGAPQGSSPAG